MKIKKCVYSKVMRWCEQVLTVVVALWAMMARSGVSAWAGGSTGGGGNSGTTVSCEDAQMRCAYRKGCGMALQNYIVGCSGVLQGDLDSSTACPETCQHALIALTSTDEGKDLMMCECSDELCMDTKSRIEVCRPQVTRAIQNETVVACRVAEWICAADALCSTALEYYNRYCKSMFHGRKCTHRCMNSISILRRQEKAAKLNSCKCDGYEEYDCFKIQKNMAKLCFHIVDEVVDDRETNEVEKRPPSDPNNARFNVASALITLTIPVVALVMIT